MIRYTEEIIITNNKELSNIWKNTVNSINEMHKKPIRALIIIIK